MQRRHPNGGGRIIGDQAVVSPSAYLHEESSVFHGAHVLGNTTLHGKTAVGGTAVVYDSIIADSVVGKVLSAQESYRVEGVLFQPTFPFVANAFIQGCSKIENHIVAGQHGNMAMLWNCWLEDAVEVRDHVRLAHTHLQHYACVCGDAQVLGTAELPLTLGGRYYIHRGEWIIAPKYFEVGGTDDAEGIHVGVTECTDGHTNLGCWCADTQRLLTAIKRRGAEHRIARAFGWRREHVEQLREGLQKWESLTN